MITDHLGSPRLVVNAATGAVVRRVSYDEFGSVVADSNPDLMPFGFSGGIYDPRTGLVRFGARDYRPSTGTWTRKEPLGILEERNPYRYAANDPVNVQDLGGMKGGAVATLPSGARNMPRPGSTQQPRRDIPFRESGAAFMRRMEGGSEAADFFEAQSEFYRQLGVDPDRMSVPGPRSVDPGAEQLQCPLPGVAEQRRTTYNEWANSEQNTAGIRPYDPCDHGPCLKADIPESERAHKKGKKKRPAPGWRWEW